MTLPRAPSVKRLIQRVGIERVEVALEGVAEGLGRGWRGGKGKRKRARHGKGLDLHAHLSRKAGVHRAGTPARILAEFIGPVQRGLPSLTASTVGALRRSAWRRRAACGAAAAGRTRSMQNGKQSGSSNLIKGATGDWEVVIGLEVHAQVASKAKLFSGASTEFGGAPNSHVSLVDAAMPGMLPVINEACIAQAVRTGLGLKAQINLVSVFDRKNYFYPDLPQGYQISQYKQPIVGEGEVEVEVDGETLQRRHRAAAPGAGRRQVDPRPAPRVLLRRSQPLGRGADGDRVQARHALGQAGAGLRHRSCAPSCAISAPATATWRRATCAPT